MRFHRTLLGSATLVIGLTAGTRPAARAPGAAGACGLVTRQEAASALGAAVPAGVEKAMNVPLQGRSVPAQYCFFGSEVVVARFELGSGARAAFDQYRQSLAAGPGYRTLAGLGDEAFAAKGQLAVRKGQTGLIVDVGQARGGGAAEMAAERALAVLALGRF